MKKLVIILVVSFAFSISAYAEMGRQQGQMGQGMLSERKQVPMMEMMQMCRQMMMGQSMMMRDMMQMMADMMKMQQYFIGIVAP